MKYAIALEGTATATSTPIYRNVSCADGLIATPDPRVQTVYDLIALNLARNPNLEFFGQRRVIDIIEEEKEVIKKVPGGGEVKEVKKWKYFQLSGFEWLTWVQAEKAIQILASGYRALGLSKGSKVTIYAETSRDWTFTALACMSQSIVISTAYPTLGQDGLCHTLQEGEVSTLFTNGDLLPMLAKIAPQCKDLKTIIYNGTADVDAIASLVNGFNIKVLSIFELEAIGAGNVVDAVPPSRDDVAVIMYTSGSTGKPKGVILTHGNLISSVVANWVGMKHLQEPVEMYLAFLPLSHVYELSVQVLVMFMGIPIGFGSVKTLTDASVRNCFGDIRELRPTLLMGVPALWEAVRKGITSKVQDSGVIANSIFNTAYNLKWALLQAGLPNLAKPLDTIVFNKIKTSVGGRLKVANVAGAVCPSSTKQFFNVVLGNFISSYGMTETTGSIISQPAQLATCLDHVGVIAQCNEVKLVNVEEGGYLVTNVPKPQGEVWVRGYNVTKGYYKQEDVTRDAITEDGWLKTGDIAELNPDGTFAMIDRKKNLVKLSNGEYIALEKLEANYKVSKYVQNICVYANPEKSYPIAIIMPVEKEIRNEFDYVDLCRRKDIKDAVLNSLKKIAKDVGFVSAEVVGLVFLSDKEWTPESGFVTAAMKLQAQGDFGQV
ncbi:hypothetical protein BDR26DRAFT_1002853 [Obelidium mucronatum]|nr:hypothetical protein BDR26DRAFT_1002853 [Obelidium mucronatum]